VSGVLCACRVLCRSQGNEEITVLPPSSLQTFPLVKAIKTSQMRAAKLWRINSYILKHHNSRSLKTAGATVVEANSRKPSLVARGRHWSPSNIGFRSILPLVWSAEMLAYSRVPALSEVSFE
jgi:hypothetical protein